MPILSAIVAAIVSFSMLFLATPRVAQNQVEQNLGDATLTLAGTVYNLAGSGVSAAATSITLTSLTIPQTGYEIQDADLSSTFYITLEPGSRTRQEIASCTTVTQNANNTATLSGCARGLLPFSPYTASSTYQFAHGGGTAVVFSNAPQLYEEFAARGNTETITGQWTFASSSLPKASSDTSTSTVGASGFNFATVNYVGDVAVTGCANGSDTVRGCVELATPTETANGTATGGSGAALVPANSTFSSTTSATNLVPVTNSSGKLSQGFLDLTASWAFTGTVTSASLTPPGTIQMYVSSTPPTGWLSADGSAYASTTYPALFAVIGYQYGSSSGNFLVPNFKGRKPVGFGSATTTYDVLGETGGEDSHVQTIGELAAHTHSTPFRTGSGGGGAAMIAGTTTTGPDSYGLVSGSTGSATAFNVLDPFIVINFIIKY